MNARICLRGKVDSEQVRATLLMAVPPGRRSSHLMEEGSREGNKRGRGRKRAGRRALWLPRLLWNSIWRATDLRQIKSSQLPRNTFRPASVMGKPPSVTRLFVGLSIV